MKKALSILLAILMVFSCTQFAAFADGTAILRGDVVTDKKVGDQFVYKFTISNWQTGVTNGLFKVNWDPSKLKAVRVNPPAAPTPIYVQYGTIFKGTKAANDLNIANGEFIIAWMGGDLGMNADTYEYDPVTDQMYFQLKFEVLPGASGTIPVTINDYMEWENNGTVLPIAPESGSVSIAKSNLVSVTSPAAVTGVPNGTAKDAAALGLPTTVTMVTDGAPVEANVTWDVAGSSYNPNDTAAQTFTVAGLATLPDTILNTNAVSLATSIEVTVAKSDIAVFYGEEILGALEGQQYEYDFTLSNWQEGVTNGMFTIRWDPTKLKAVFAEGEEYQKYGALFTGTKAVNINNIANGEYIVGWIGGNLPATGADQVYFSLKFEVLEGATGTIPVTIVESAEQATPQWEDDGVVLPISVRSGSISIYTTSDITVTAGEGGTVSGGGTMLGSGTQTTLVATEETGYNFVNWTKDGVEVSTNPSYTITVTDQDEEYVANFTKEIYTVTYKDKSGATIETQQVAYQENATAPAAPEVTGYTFTAWSHDGTNITADTVITSAYTANKYALTLDNDGATQTYEVTFDAAVGTLPVVSKVGYTFNGWFTAATGGTKLNASDIWTTAATATYYAQYSINSYVITVQKANGGQSIVTGAGTYVYNTDVTLTAAPHSDYQFVNWTKDGIEVSTDTTYTFKATANETYTANFKTKGFTFAQVNALIEAALASGLRTDIITAYNAYQSLDESQKLLVKKYNELWLAYNAELNEITIADRTQTLGESAYGTLTTITVGASPEDLISNLNSASNTITIVATTPAAVYTTYPDRFPEWVVPTPTVTTQNVTPIVQYTISINGVFENETDPEQTEIKEIQPNRAILVKLKIQKDVYDKLLGSRVVIIHKLANGEEETIIAKAYQQDADYYVEFLTSSFSDFVVATTSLSTGSANTAFAFDTAKTYDDVAAKIAYGETTTFGWVLKANAGEDMVTMEAVYAVETAKATITKATLVDQLKNDFAISLRSEVVGSMTYYTVYISSLNEMAFTVPNDNFTVANIEVTAKPAVMAGTEANPITINYITQGTYENNVNFAAENSERAAALPEAIVINYEKSKANVDFNVTLTHELEQLLADSKLTITITDIASGKATQVQLMQGTLASVVDTLGVFASFDIVQGLNDYGKQVTKVITFTSDMAFGTYKIDVVADGFRSYSKIIQVNETNLKKDALGFYIVSDVGIYDSIFDDAYFGIDDNKSSFAAGEIVKDGSVDIYDLSAVATYFGGSDVLYDLNRDGIISAADLAVVIRNWEK